MIEDYTEVDSSQIGIKLRFLIAFILFLTMLYCKYTDSLFLGFHIEEIIDMINDNQYYTILQKYVRI